MAQPHILGWPRIGARREWKFALEAFWRGEADAQQLEAVATRLRSDNWRRQRDAGCRWITAGDFAWYDHMLNQSVLLGAIPRRFGFDAQALTLTQYFELARGSQRHHAMEMTKWFDTNYHYLVPELDADTTFDGGADFFFAEIEQALALGHPVKAVLVGPVTYLWLSKCHGGEFDRLTLLPALLNRYENILQRLAKLGVQWVQFDEPALVTELDARWTRAIETSYRQLARAGVKMLLATYFDDATDVVKLLVSLPIDGFHIDLARAPQQLRVWLDLLPPGVLLSAGVVDGRNIWRSDLGRLLDLLEPVQARIGERLLVAPSCSLLHVPVELAQETALDAEIRPWLAFGAEKIDELRVLARALGEGRPAVAAELAAADAALQSRRQSARVTDAAVRRRLAELTPALERRHSPFDERIVQQRRALALPPLPTTTIGSFPQTCHIRQVRAAHRRGEISAEQYWEHMRTEIALAVKRQETLGLDALVHGEAERNDMVEFFGEQLQGYAFSGHGWVQSYGSRCVKPPIIYGDVSRPRPMTVEIARYAQTLTEKPMKGMLTGPVTLLQWSFVRDDQPRETTALQLALAIRDEVADLESAGIRLIQIDEPALREGLPLKRRDWQRYLDWAVRAFRIAVSPVRDDTQIHTHMCYAEFNDILPAIAAMDADVITIETSRSNMELLEGFGAFAYPNDIGPGVYDIHSPRIPTVAEMVRLLEKAARVIPLERLWINPDCGLKTRGWPETELALANMVEAARQLRARLGQAASHG